MYPVCVKYRGREGGTTPSYPTVQKRSRMAAVRSTGCGAAAMLCGHLNTLSKISARFKKHIFFGDFDHSPISLQLLYYVHQIFIGSNVEEQPNNQYGLSSTGKSRPHFHVCFWSSTITSAGGSHCVIMLVFRTLSFPVKLQS